MIRRKQYLILVNLLVGVFVYFCPAIAQINRFVIGADWIGIHQQTGGEVENENEVTDFGILQNLHLNTIISYVDGAHRYGAGSVNEQIFIAAGMHNMDLISHDGPLRDQSHSSRFVLHAEYPNDIGMIHQDASIFTDILAGEDDYLESRDQVPRLRDINPINVLRLDRTSIPAGQPPNPDPVVLSNVLRSNLLFNGRSYGFTIRMRPEDDTDPNNPPLVTVGVSLRGSNVWLERTIHSNELSVNGVPDQNHYHEVTINHFTVNNATLTLLNPSYGPPVLPSDTGHVFPSALQSIAACEVASLKTIK